MFCCDFDFDYMVALNVSGFVNLLHRQRVMPYGKRISDRNRLQTIYN